MDDHWEKVKKLRGELKKDWSDLWSNKYEDDIKAEGVSTNNYPKLFVDRGEIIHATREYKQVSFSDILEEHIGKEEADRVNVDPNVGGWRKFAKTHFSSNREKSVRERPKVKVDMNQQQRKNGSGWLNRARIYKKMRDSSYDV